MTFTKGYISKVKVTVQTLQKVVCRLLFYASGVDFVKKLLQVQGHELNQIWLMLYTVVFLY